MERFWHPDLEKLNSEEINWNAPRSAPCEACRRLGVRWPPTSGSYASTLGHLERVLRPLPEPRNEHRILLVFQDPRPYERHFVAAHPAKDPMELEPTECRYFCLTPLDWQDLRLNGLTGSEGPCWPTEETAHMYLHRYLRPGSWSYNGIVAYFLYLFRPSDAYITNLAKCHFGGRSQANEVYDTCARLHLRRESEIFRPTLVVSFTARLRQLSRWNELVAGSHTPNAVLSLYHPAAQVRPQDKIRRFVNSARHCREVLERLGCGVGAVLEGWSRHCQKALQEDGGNGMPNGDITLKKGNNHHPIYQYVHDMRMILSSHYMPHTYYLLVSADVRWPNDPEPGLRRIFAILMQYSRNEGENVCTRFPAHIMEEDADSVLHEFEAFIEKNSTSP